jgi:hypothetical protein
MEFPQVSNGDFPDKLFTCTLGGVFSMNLIGDESWVGGAQVTYASGAQTLHGMDRGTGEPATIDLVAGEFFTNISGTNPTYVYGRNTVLVRGVASLTFGTNKQVFGPFGVPSLDKSFDVQGPVYGFHGAVSRGSTPQILTAIGVWKGRAGKQSATCLSITGISLL